MVMKTTAKTKNYRSFFKKFWWIFPILLLFIGSVSFLAYNKYLDQQNVNNMKQLLLDFEQLERDVETETGEKYYIESSCGSIGVFAESYGCTITLMVGNSTPIENLLVRYENFIQDYPSCEVLLNGKDKYVNALDCNILVRGSNINTAKKIFY